MVDTCCLVFVTFAVHTGRCFYSVFSSFDFRDGIALVSLSFFSHLDLFPYFICLYVRVSFCFGGAVNLLHLISCFSWFSLEYYFVGSLVEEVLG